MNKIIENGKVQALPTIMQTKIFATEIKDITATDPRAEARKLLIIVKEAGMHS